MNLIPDLPSQKDGSVKQEQVAKKQQEYHLIGKQRKVAGHTLYEFDKITKQIRPAVIDRKAILQMDGSIKAETRIDVKQDCFYLQALNIKNAEKKLRKLCML